MYKEKSQRKMSAQIPKYSTVLSLYPNYTLIQSQRELLFKDKADKKN